MPLRWRIFRIVAYLHVASSAILLGLSTYWNLPIANGEILLFLSITWLVFGVLIANGVVNIFILERYYPDQKPGKLLNTWWFLFLIPFMLILSLLIIVTTANYVDLVSQENPESWNTRQLIFVIAIGVVSITGIVVCYLQISLRNTIRYNYKAKFESFLE